MLVGNDVDDAEWRHAMQQMKAMGVQVLEIGQVAWHDIEKQPGVYEWGYVERVLKINKKDKLGFEFVTDFMFINPALNGKPRLPKYLKGLSFDDKRVIDALSNMYEAYFALPGAESTRWLFQHFENAASVVEKRRDDIPRIQSLLRESFARAKRLRPDIKTGVCVQQYSEHTHWPASEIKRWNIDLKTDVIPVISFRPQEFQAKGDASATIKEFERILKASQGRPIALHECGQHSSVKAQSSDQEQVAFVKQLFALLRKHHRNIEFATWYEYKDIKPGKAKAVGAVLGLAALKPQIIGYLQGFLGSCGLFTYDGKAKPAAHTWSEEADSYYKYRSR
jgi:hypothetical protein